MLSPKNLGLAGGILWGLCMAICTVLAMYTGYSSEFLHMMASIYPGFKISWSGAALGFLYGFLDSFVGLFLFAWLYNKLNRRMY